VDQIKIINNKIYFKSIIKKNNEFEFFGIL
jgi:hypothetical protein